MRKLLLVTGILVFSSQSIASESSDYSCSEIKIHAEISLRSVKRSEQNISRSLKENKVSHTLIDLLKPMIPALIQLSNGRLSTMHFAKVNPWDLRYYGHLLCTAGRQVLPRQFVVYVGTEPL